MCGKSECLSVGRDGERSGRRHAFSSSSFQDLYCDDANMLPSTLDVGGGSGTGRHTTIGKSDSKANSKLKLQFPSTLDTFEMGDSSMTSANPTL